MEPMKRDPYNEIHAIQADTWRTDAACRTFPTEWWYPLDGNYAKNTARARSICKSCPVKDECLEAALRRNEEGIWGDTNIRERRALRRTRNVQKILVCVHCRNTFEKPAHRAQVSMFCSEQCRKGRQISNELKTRRLRAS
jgi:WhiB family redox-sensing transcriptional regulator